MAQPLTPITIPDVGADNSGYWNDFYGSIGITGREPAGGGLTSRSIKTVKIDPNTGQPASLTPQMSMFGRGLPTDYQARMNNWAVENALRGSKPTRVALDANGKQVQPIGYAEAPLNPAVGAATALASGGIKPSWANPQGQGGPKFPVTSTPQIELAYADVVAGKPGAMKRYAALLADAAQAGQINGPDASAGETALPTSFRTSKTGREVQVGQQYQGTNGYTYRAEQGGTFKNEGYSPTEQVKRDAEGKAIGERNRKSAGTTRNVFGDNNAFQPKSVQNSVRFQTGY